VVAGADPIMPVRNVVKNKMAKKPDGERDSGMVGKKKSGCGAADNVGGKYHGR